MKDNVPDRVAEDLFSTLPLIGRSIRRKLLKTALTSIHEALTPHHLEIMKLLGEAGTLHVAEIGERLQIARPQMTRLIDKLVDLDIVERQTRLILRSLIKVKLFLKSMIAILGTLLGKHSPASQVKN